MVKPGAAGNTSNSSVPEVIGFVEGLPPPIAPPSFLATVPEEDDLPAIPPPPAFRGWYLIDARLVRCYLLSSLRKVL